MGASELACILCGVDEHTEIGKKGEFTIVKCSRCGLVFALPRPDESQLIDFYHSLSSGLKTFSPAQSFIRRLKFRYMTSTIKRYFPRDKQIRLLELGCSQGQLLDAVKEDKRIIATGIDLDTAALERARNRGHNVFEGTLESLKFPAGSFDAIVAVHVIEHLHSPLNTLAEMNRILSPGGVLFSIVPCVTHIKSRIAGIKWKYYTPPGHLWFFSPKTFSLLLQKTGFTAVFSSCFYNRAHLRSIGKKISNAVLSA